MYSVLPLLNQIIYYDVMTTNIKHLIQDIWYVGLNGVAEDFCSAIINNVHDLILAQSSRPKTELKHKTEDFWWKRHKYSDSTIRPKKH